MELAEALKYIEKAQRQFSAWDAKVEAGERYYNNEGDIVKTGAAMVDAVNG